MLPESHLPKFWVIIPATGIGERLGAGMPKQYLKILNKTILDHSISIFLKSDFINIIQKIIVIISKTDTLFEQSIFKNHPKINIAHGGAQRVNSVYHGLVYLSNLSDVSPDDWVIVHDAVRPCLHENDLQNLIYHTQAYPASSGAILATPVDDSLKYSKNNKTIDHAVSRECLWRALTPQIFKLGVLKESIEFALVKKIAVTDEASSMELLNLSPNLIQAQYPNPKITVASDLCIAEGILHQRTQND